MKRTWTAACSSRSRDTALTTAGSWAEKRLMFNARMPARGWIGMARWRAERRARAVGDQRDHERQEQHLLRNMEQHSLVSHRDHGRQQIEDGERQSQGEGGAMPVTHRPYCAAWTAGA